MTDAQVRSHGLSSNRSSPPRLLRPAILKPSKSSQAINPGTFQAAIEERDPDRALKYALSGVNALAGDEKGAAEVAGAVREQIVAVVRRLTSVAKEAGRADQVSSGYIPIHTEFRHRFAARIDDRLEWSNHVLRDLLLNRPRRRKSSSSLLPNRRRRRSS